MFGLPLTLEGAMPVVGDSDPLLPVIVSAVGPEWPGSIGPYNILVSGSPITVSCIRAGAVEGTLWYSDTAVLAEAVNKVECEVPEWGVSAILATCPDPSSVGTKGFLIIQTVGGVASLGFAVLAASLQFDWTYVGAAVPDNTAVAADGRVDLASGHMYLSDLNAPPMANGSKAYGYNDNFASDLILCYEATTISWDQVTASGTSNITLGRILKDTTYQGRMLLSNPASATPSITAVVRNGAGGLVTSDTKLTTHTGDHVLRMLWMRDGATAYFRAYIDDTLITWSGEDEWSGGGFGEIGINVTETGLSNNADTSLAGTNTPYGFTCCDVTRTICYGGP